MFKFLMTAAMAVALSAPALAHPLPLKPPVPLPVLLPTNTGGVVSALIKVKGDFLKDLSAVAEMAGKLNPVTGEAWDTPTLWCLNGTPAQGTPGQDGYVPAYGGLIAWVNGLTLPAPVVDNPPPVPAGGGVAAAAEEAWLQAQAAKQNLAPFVNTIVNQLNNFGPPESVMKPCGALIQDRIQTVQKDVAQGGVTLAQFNAVILKYLPQVALK